MGIIADNIAKHISIARKGTLHSSVDMTKIILLGSVVADAFLTAILIISYSSFGHVYLLGRIVAGGFILIYLGITCVLAIRRYVRFSAWMLIVLYVFIGILVLHTWGINAPIGTLALSFVIILASVMLGAKKIIPVTIGTITILVTMQYFSVIGISQPDRSIFDDGSSYVDVANYSIIFCVFALVAWLSGSKTETTLLRATKAESALEEERDMLAARLDEQTRIIKNAQEKELRQLYKFAELGQLTTIILHELANYLSILTLDIDDIEDRQQNSVAISHAKESIKSIDEIIDQVRNQIKNSDDVYEFDAYPLVRDSLDQLRKKLNNTNIKLFIEDGEQKSYNIYGDPMRLSQAVTILITNAEQASKKKHSEIMVEIHSKNKRILISVKDHGKGIDDEARKLLFRPQKSARGLGLGIGLHVTKQIIETHFKGSMWLSPTMEYTQFNIEIPRFKSLKSYDSQNAHIVPSPHR
jgi:signal transduction histidine kinase